MTIRDRIKQIIATHKPTRTICIWDNSTDGELADVMFEFDEFDKFIDNEEYKDILNKQLDGEEKYIKDGCKIIALSYNGRLRSND